MSEPLPVDLMFREAAMASKLVSEKQWRRAAMEVKEARKEAGLSAPVEIAEREEVIGQIAKILIRDKVLTEYQAQQLRAGRTKLTLGPYIVTEFLGQGGMGQVFGGVHEIMGRHCAIKVLPLEKSDDLARESFHREIRLQASLDCPYLVRAFDAGREGSVHFLVTEYVPGTDLRRLVKENGPLSVQQAASIIAQAAAGLAYAHESGLIHRDIKPANILVTPEGHAKVADVGLAALAFGGDDDPRAGKVVGTADYLSPEQIRTPHLVGPQSDLYSLGCTLYYCITGKVPFPGGDSRSKCRRHLSQAPWDPRKFTPDLPTEFVDILADMMEKDTRKRVQSATEVVQRLSVFAATTQDEGDEWLAELGLELNVPKVPDRSQDRLLGSAGMKTRMVPAGSTSATKWKTTSSGQSESASGISDVDEGSQASGANAGPEDVVIPPLPAAVGEHASPIDAYGHPPKLSTVPPPVATGAKMVSRSTLFIAVFVAILVSGAAGFATAWWLR
ncbi:serine/threonine protein kinase [Neorhodopirellula pilleata]|uniref:Serine/threonine-protein kinase StkP n=1 Tax=Neorhodopirellula pilleata TaxID=2714738 RepID=A0A5C6AGV0_9BACT|nr:serine/threonine-protein kinase [Neorhodopirellula pilleata]TWT98839.1 Serine/threonine-protein kinase StkP [Neorhodopirellula pilleata]